jgi:hypothetical protein
VYPGSVTGFYSLEEVIDFDYKPDIKDITPIKPVIQSPEKISLADLPEDIPEVEKYLYGSHVARWNDLF